MNSAVYDQAWSLNTICFAQLKELTSKTIKPPYKTANLLQIKVFLENQATEQTKTTVHVVNPLSMAYSRFALCK